MVLVAQVLSVSNRSRSPRAGGKTAPRKRAKKAKSDFHGPKKHSTAEKSETLEQVRKRVSESLDHLGHQKLSNEPGGYDLRGWLKSLKTLLNDFEEKMGVDGITEEFHNARNEIEAEFTKLGSTKEIDEEIEDVRREEGDIRAELKSESERITARLSAIGGEKTSKNLELEQEREKLKKLEEERRSAGFFSRLVGRSGPSLEPAQQKVENLEKGLKMLEEEAVNLQAVRRSLEGAKVAAGGIHEDLWKRLDALRQKLTELGAAKEAKAQLAEEREKATASLNKIISELKLKQETEET